MAMMKLETPQGDTLLERIPETKVESVIRMFELGGDLVNRAHLDNGKKLSMAKYRKMCFEVNQQLSEELRLSGRDLQEAIRRSWKNIQNGIELL